MSVVIRPFDGYLVNPAKVHAVVTPAYDAMLPQDRRDFAEQNPDNYVNVMRTQEEFVNDANPPSLDDILKLNKSQLDQLFAQEAFVRTQGPGYYLYRLAIDGHEQIGVIANIRVEEYATGRLKKHEDTQIEKENLLTGYFESVGVTSNPICVAFHPNDTVTSAINEAMGEDPYLQFSAWDAVEQTVWKVSDPALCERLEAGFKKIEFTYLTDGHHRCAAAVRYANIVKETNPDSISGGNHDYLLVALFPADQLRIFSYFRCVKDLNGLTELQLLSEIEKRGLKVRKKSNSDPDSILPIQSRDITMFVDGTAYGVRIPDELVPEDDPVESLDVSILQTQILGPIFSIEDARSDDRLSFVPGVAGVSGLIDRYRNDGWRLGFACFNTTIQEVIAVADAGRTMPPKSTWFDPKLRAGLFLRTC